MALMFIGIDPNTGDHESPTVWVDLTRRELVMQGWEPTPEVEAECSATVIPGHAVGIPDGEAVIRIPARMIHMVREACDALEGAPDVP
ncbi:hypothetical protein [Streptomyces xanthochromogenes]|uniref:hypothetical protein n=1 Tax=Streptomyces xanthochromogenes TaxID=67384 RepID=UPI0034440F0E